jgi:hypothetical protein
MGWKIVNPALFESEEELERHLDREQESLEYCRDFWSSHESKPLVGGICGRAAAECRSGLEVLENTRRLVSKRRGR